MNKKIISFSILCVLLFILLFIFLIIFDQPKNYKEDLNYENIDPAIKYATGNDLYYGWPLSTIRWGTGIINSPAKLFLFSCIINIFIYIAISTVASFLCVRFLNNKMILVMMIIVIIVIILITISQFSSWQYILHNFIYQRLYEKSHYNF